MKCDLWLGALACLALLGCAEQTKNQVDLACPGGGEALELDGEALCVYERAVVIETGFLCPPDRPHQVEYEDIAVCSTLEELPNDDLRDLYQRYRASYPDPAPLPPGYCSTAMPCDGAQSCQAGVCAEPDPPQGCGDGEACAPGQVCVDGACQGDGDGCPDQDGDSICDTDDCDPNDPGANGQEIPGDGIDNDCDGQVDELDPIEGEGAVCGSDADCGAGLLCQDGTCQSNDPMGGGCPDGDGDGICDDEDCGPEDPALGGQEIPGDGLDNDCDGQVDE